MSKKFLSLLLALTMVFGLFAGLSMSDTVAFAEDTSVWKKVDSSEIADGDEVVLSLHEADSNTYYFLSNAATSKDPSASKTVTVSGDTIDQSELGDGYVWTIHFSGSTFTLEHGGNYLCYGSKTSVGVTTNSSNWKFGESQYVQDAGGSDRFLAVVKTSFVVRAYAIGNLNDATYSIHYFQFWKLSDGSAPAHEHQWSNWTSNNDGTHSRTCAGTDCPIGTQTENCSFDEGTVTTEPTCVDTGVKHFTCQFCGYEKDETIPATGQHTDANNDGRCDVCGEEMPTATVFTLGTELHEGDRVVIYYPAGSLALSVNASGDKLSGTDASIEGEELTVLSNDTATAVMTVEFADATNFRLKTADGKYLTTPAGGNGLSFGTEASDYTLWYLETADASAKKVYIRSTNAAYNGNKNQALEYFSGFTVYGIKTNNSQYLFQLFILANPEAHVHDWDEGTVTTEPTCTKKGVKTFTCSGCAETYTEEIPMIAHTDANGDGKCDACDGTIYSAAATLNDGDRVIVVFAAESKAMTSVASDTKLTAAEVNAQAGVTVPVNDNNIWTVKTADEGFYLLSGDGKYLTTGETGSSLTLEDEANDYSLWSLEVVDADAKIVFIRSVNAAYNGKTNQAVEYYNGLFTTYGTKDNNTNDAFKLTLYTLPAEPEPLADGYYLVGTMNEWKPSAEYKFEKNPNDDNYMLETGLTVGHEIKVVGIFNGEETWYPGGTGNNYIVESEYAGRKTVYFKPTYVDAWAHFGGHIYIDSMLLNPGAEIYGSSLNLKGDIALNFFVYLPDELLADANAYVTLTVNEGNEYEKVNTLPISSAKTRTVDGKELRIFTVNLRPKQMNDEVLLRVYTGAGELYNLYNHNTGMVVTDGYAYSVHTYVEKVHQNNSTETDLINLVDAMYDYGVLAQINFNYQIADLPDVQANLDAVTAETLAEYEAVITPETVEGVSYKGMTLVLDSETVLRVYFTVADGVDLSEYTFKVNGTTYTLQQKGSDYYIEIANIAAKNLSKWYTVTVIKDGETVQTVKACALSYAYSVLNSSGAEESLKNLVKGLYLYNRAADDYFI